MVISDIRSDIVIVKMYCMYFLACSSRKVIEEKVKRVLRRGVTTDKINGDTYLKN